MARHLEVGRLGEDIAAGYLERNGYRIRERNFRCEHGEIDLIVTKDEYLVFVEVKTRSQDKGYHPTLAITRAKKNRLRLLGEFYRTRHPDLPLQPRFDVLAVVLGASGSETEQVEHFYNAF